MRGNQCHWKSCLTLSCNKGGTQLFGNVFCAFRHPGFATSTCCVFTQGQHSGGRDVFLLIQINNWTDWSILKCPAKIVGPTAFFFSLCSPDCLWCNLISPGQIFVSGTENHTVQLPLHKWGTCSAGCSLKLLAKAGITSFHSYEQLLV